MTNVIDMTGETIGLLTVLKRVPSDGQGAMWRCLCECGRVAERRGTQIRREVRRGNQPTCGAPYHRGTHRMTGTRLYQTWQNMLNRCRNPNVDRYEHYGSRGISVCQEWEESFKVFQDWAITNGYDDDLTIERIDVDGDYRPGNCTWIPPEDQVLNRTDSRLLTWNGKTQTVREWSEELGVSYGAMQLRFTRGWSTERIFTQSYRGS